MTTPRHKGLPPRSGEPGQSEFGQQNDGGGEDDEVVLLGSSMVGKEGMGKLEFLDYVTCNIWSVHKAMLVREADDELVTTLFIMRRIRGNSG
jgi:hypothetical protein